ncbi:metallophosphoesterase [Streptomyces sp. NRRL S-920]|uniref:metallophosphoesterase n=1 Tax=Streptomyces sp. NRRL S-920 TaxID=1463921 RepID=UPI0004CC04CE|nr:metallophosphoesterase [Streptomyces sp. NRRL S-920]
MAVLAVLAGLAVLAAFAGLHWYVWRRLVRDTTAGPGLARRAGTVLFVVAPLLMFAALVAERAGAPFLLQRVLAWPGFLWLALALYLLLAVLVGELARPLLRRWAERTPSGDPAPEAPMSEAPVSEAPAPAESAPAPSRRLFVSRVVGGAAAAAAVGTVGYGTYGVLRGPRVKRVTVPLAKLPRAAHGFRIAVVSDIHLGPILGRGFTRRVVDTINATQPDLIAVVGDLVDGSVEDLGPAAAPLAGLRARHGAYFVTGNHEYFSGAEQWVDHVRELGLRPLRNARAELPWFDLAGVDDVAGEGEGKGPDFARALGDRDRSRASVLLAHQPVVIHDAVEHGVDLQLSGHTHGGQLWPGNLVADLANPTLAGLERYGDTQLYVTRGAGAWGPPVRVGAPSDITVVELASRQA